MYWADKLIQNLDRNKKHRVDDGSTPSGHYHVGSLRAVLTHGLVYEAMKHADFNVDFTYFFNDMDPMDGLPVYLGEKVYEEHMGRPLYRIPAPDGKSESFARQYADEYIESFQQMGFKPTVFWSSQLYMSGSMNEYIKLVLDNNELIRKIYLEVAKQEKPENWYPLQVICLSCGKVGTTIVTGWDGSEVTFECQENLVEWAKGCGYKGKVSPFDGKAKLMWKVDWATMWARLGVTVEGAGKDHMTAGGSHDIAAEIAQKVLKIEVPFSFMNEFFLIGGAKMSSSKGKGFRAVDLLEILPPELAKFLFVRTPFRTALNFDPSRPDVIPDLFDDYDQTASVWFESGDKTPQGRMFQASQIGQVSSEKMFLPRFRVVAKLIQMPGVDLEKYFGDEKKSPLNDKEKEILEERIKYAKIWLKEFATEEDNFEVKKELPQSAKKFTGDQKEFLKNLHILLTSREFSNGDELQQEIFELAKKSPEGTKGCFAAIYTVFIDKTHGPKAGHLLFDLIKKDKEFVLNRLKSV